MFLFAPSGFGGNIGKQAPKLMYDFMIKQPVSQKVVHPFGKYAEIVDPLLKYGVTRIGSGFNNFAHGGISDFLITLPNVLLPAVSS